MSTVIVNLHGADHLARRRLENRLFRRDTFDFYEQDRLPSILSDALQPMIEEGRGDLLSLGKRAMMHLSIDVAGVDIDRHPRLAHHEAFEQIFDIMGRLARASTVAHATGDKQAIIDDGNRALAEFETDFFAGARSRRLDVMAQVDRGELPAEALPRDVLTTLLRNADDLDLPEAAILREVAYFPWVGSHSTSMQFVHAMHHIFEWIEEHPSDRPRLVTDDRWRQTFVHESLRLHPASPVAVRISLEETPLENGVAAAGDQVIIDIERANRDRTVFGDDADRFNPLRALGERTSRWGLSFGSGMHACLGQELAGGLEEVLDPGSHLHGAIAVMAGALLAAGATPDPQDPPVVDSETVRAHFERYPVLIRADDSERQAPA